MTKQILKLAIIGLFTIGFMGCATKINVTFKSEGKIINKSQNIQFALIKKQKGLTNKESDVTQVSVQHNTQSRIGTVDNVIIGSLLKNDISTLSDNEFKKLSKENLLNSIIVEWGISGRINRGDGAYSQEVTVLVRNASTRVLIYQGIGEYIGHTEIDDLRGALLAALKNFKVNK